MSLRFGAGLRVRLDDGRVLREELFVPPGFAGDPDRESVSRAKFLREVGAALSPERAARLLRLLEAEELPAPGRIAAEATERRRYGAERGPGEDRRNPAGTREVTRG
jgi:hypothetical protein